MGKQGGTGAVDRTMELIQMLYQGKGLRAEDIAESFGVDIRTAYRDLNRLGNILEDAGDGQKRLAAHLKGQCTVHDLVNVLGKTGTGQLFPVTEKMKILREYREARYESLLDAVYKRRGWNNNGVPKIEFLKKIGMDFPEVIDVIREYQ